MAYKTLDKLISEIQEEIKKLEFGQLKIQDLDELVDYSKELHERLVVLRYKAYDHKIKSKESLEGEIPLLFKMESKDDIQPEISPNQINLIDAIEDIDSPEEEGGIDEGRIEDSSFDKSSGTEEQKKEEPIVEEAKQEEPVIEEPIVEEAKQEEPKKEKKKPKKEKPVAPPANSLFDEDDSLVSKHAKTPISNLKSIITLNQKFRFISALFGGEADEYNATIGHLDQLTTFDEANTYLNENIRNKYELTGEEEEIEIFMDLVQRRYL